MMMKSVTPRLRTDILGSEEFLDAPYIDLARLNDGADGSLRNRFNPSMRKN